MRSLHSLIVLAAVLTIACGKEGAQGPAGPQGVPGPTKRLPTYCNSVLNTVSAANSWTLTASCNAATDIPVEGWCFEPSSPLPSGAFLANSTPVNWNDITKIAGWTCTWGWQGPVGSAFSAQVEICCATPQ
jgi:hypothetical protein